MEKLGRILFILGVVVASAACEPAPSTKPVNDPIETANRLIDQGQFDTAIQNLEEIRQTSVHQQKSVNPKLLEVLASAYAGRAGLMVDKHWGFLIGFRAPKLQQANVFLPMTEGESTNGLGRIYKFAASLQMWAERIDHLPVVTGSARADTESAIGVLAGQQERGSRVYRALLGLILVKSDIAGAGEIWGRAEKQFRQIDIKNLQSMNNISKLCQPDIQQFALQSGTILQRLEFVIQDLAISFPSKRDELSDALIRSRDVTKPLLAIGNAPCSF